MKNIISKEQAWSWYEKATIPEPLPGPQPINERLEAQLTTMGKEDQRRWVFKKRLKDDQYAYKLQHIKTSSLKKNQTNDVIDLTKDPIIAFIFTCIIKVNKKAKITITSIISFCKKENIPYTEELCYRAMYATANGIRRTPNHTIFFVKGSKKPALLIKRSKAAGIQPT